MMKSQIGMVLMVLALMTAAGGCATSPVGPSPADEVAGMLADYQAACEAGDVEAMLAAFSDSWSNAQGMDKRSLRSYFEGLSNQGLLQDTTVEIGEVVIDGGNATVTPLSYDGPTGKLSFTSTLKKEADGMWRFVGGEPIN